MSRPASRGGLVGILVLVVIGFVLRVQAGSANVEVLAPTATGPGSLWIDDLDTARRLHRIERLARSDQAYPSVNPLDGAPDGYVLHWTLPMDWVIRALDPLVSWLEPVARPWEAGAVWSGPLLGALAVLAFGLLVRRLLGSTGATLLATALYGCSFTAVEITSYGNGDHQSLQHLLLVVTLLGFAQIVTGRASARLPWLVGAALGGALWVSSESAVALQLAAVGAFVHVLLARGDDRQVALVAHLRWSLVATAVGVVAALVEHGGSLAYEWDVPSGFHLHQIVVFVVFVALVRPLDARVRNPLVATGAAAGIALVAGLVPLVVPALGDAFRAQLDSFAASNRWVQATVDEYRPLFVLHGVVLPSRIAGQFGGPVFLLPFAVAAWALAARSEANGSHGSLGGRLAIVLATVGTFALACLEVKLAHVFQILHVWLLVAGGAVIVRFVAEKANASARAPLLARVASVLVVLSLWTQLPEADPRRATLRGVERELVTALGQQIAQQPATDDKRAVLTFWYRGARFLRELGVPVVASGYHRNLAGIEDSYRLFLANGWAQCEPILRRRGVRWVVSSAEPEVFTKVADVLGGESYGRVVVDEVGDDGTLSMRLALEPRAEQTVLFAMMLRKQLNAHLVPVYQSRATRAVPGPEGKMFKVPVHRIWRVVYPGE